MKVNNFSKEATSAYTNIGTYNFSSNEDAGKINLYLFPFNARNFDYDKAIERMTEAVLEYALPNKIRKNYQDKPRHLVKLALEKFRNSDENRGELGEFMLYCFLEGHMTAPKIMTKLDLKTSSEMYVNGSDGVHLYKLTSSRYQLIFCESKTYKDLGKGITSAMDSISEFINEENGNGKKKSGRNFERMLLSNHLEDLELEEDEKRVVKKITYPFESEYDDIELEDAFAIFLGYEIDVKKEGLELTTVEFKEKIKKKINLHWEKQKEEIYKKILEKNLQGYTFYVYVLPFTNLAENRKKMTKELFR